MKFFSGFKWAVPQAFSDAVALCRFEEGDILYDTTQAYNNDWDKARQFIGHHLQVKYPARASEGASEKGGGVFRSNWDSEVRLDLYKNLERVGVGQIHTTQGRLYTAIWKGDISVLNKSTKEPQIPMTVANVAKDLQQTTRKAKELSKGFPVFVMARDLSNPVSRQKYFKVLATLKRHLPENPNILTPGQAGIIEYGDIAPTVEIAFFSTNGTSADELYDLIKRAVYIPSKGSTRDSFRISAHGMIV